MIGGIAGLGPATLTRPTTSFGSAGPGQAAAGAAGASGPAGSFAAMLANMASDTVTTLKGAEGMSMEALQGKADTRQVVDAVMGAEQSLQTAVAIRDKIVSAYLEISRMPI